MDYWIWYCYNNYSTRNSRHSLARLTQMPSCNIPPKSNNLVDAQACSRLFILHRRFCPRAILDALSRTLSMASLSLTRKGDHAGLAYSYIGLTCDLKSNEKISVFLPTVRFNRPSTLFALFTATST